MKKTTVIYLALSLVLMAYLVMALTLTRAGAAADMCRDIQINVVDSASRNFVSKQMIDYHLDGLVSRIASTPRDSVNTLEIERKIMSLDNIESVNALFLNNGVLRIDVTPLIPVARVFDTKGGTYYINRAGKRMEAAPEFRMDVPIVIGNFNPNRDPSICFPLLDYLTEHDEIASIVNSIEIQDDRDIVIVPRFYGHVVNIGDINDLENKFDRLKVFYSDVMPSKGWEFYDTISVKWRRQVVAHRRIAREKPPEVVVEEHEDIDDAETMGTGQIADN